METKQPISNSARQNIIFGVSRSYCAAGYVETKTDGVYYSRVFTKSRTIDHELHAIATVFTLGLWGIIWLILSIKYLIYKNTIVIVSVDEYGNLETKVEKHY